jgi:hypothetical protein
MQAMKPVRQIYPYIYNHFCIYSSSVQFYNLILTKTVLETYPPRHLDGNRRLRLQFERAPDDGHSGARNMLSSAYATKQ